MAILCFHIFDGFARKNTGSADLFFRSVTMGLRPTKLDEYRAGADSVLWSLRQPRLLICGKWFFDPAVLPRWKSRGPFSRDCGIRAGSKEQVRATP